MREDLKNIASNVVDPKKLTRNYYHDTINETEKFGKNFIREMTKKEVNDIIEIRCGLFPCNLNYWHSKPQNKLGKRCRWCEDKHKDEDEKHLLEICKEPPILNELDCNYKELCFGNIIDPDRKLRKMIDKYKCILKKRGEKT